MNTTDRVAVMKQELAQLKKMLIGAKAAASQVQYLEDLIRVTASAIRDIEDGDSPDTVAFEYSGLKVIDAVVAYLKKRGKLEPVRIKDELLPALVDGGALRRTSNSARWRILRTAISMNVNSGKVIYNKPEDTVALPQK